MFDFLVPILITLTIFVTVYRIFELFVRKNERMRIIEKAANVPPLDQNCLREDITAYCPQSLRRSYMPLRCGLLAIGIGLGLLVAFLLVGLATNGRYYANTDGYNWMVPRVVYPSCVCLFGGIGLLMSYVIERKDDSRCRKVQGDDGQGTGGHGEKNRG